MPGGRPTDDPKTKLVGVRLTERHLRQVELRAHRDGVTFSEALRRCLDDAARETKRSPRGRRG